MTTTPNILFVITDQQRADHAGFGGSSIVRTPHLDALAARATNFTRAYVANPICMPNRSSILTGRMPSSHGVIFNDRALEWGSNTFVRMLRGAGYRTGLIGKSHLQLGVDKDLIPNAGVDPALRDGYPGESYVYEFTDRYLDAGARDPDDFYGFDHVEFSIDHGSRISGHHLRWALDKGARLEDIVVPMSGEAPGQHRSDLWWQIYQPPYAAELHSTQFVTDRTIAFVEEAAAQRKPWMAWCSFPDPHHPLTPPGDWFHRHDPNDMPVPASFGDPLTDAPDYVQRTRRRGPMPVWVLPFGIQDPFLAQQALAATYGMIEFIDAGVGQILAAIDRLGATDDTIVVFTSDHGDMMGDHGLLMKGSLHYQGVLRVPLLIATPGRPAARTDSLACSVDLGPTLLDLCGVDAFGGMQGRSLGPILEDPGAHTRQHVLIEDDLPPHIAPLLRLPEKIRSLVTDEGRFMRDSSGQEQLFDLDADPDELNDLSAKDPARRTSMLGHLADAMMEADDSGRGVPANVAPGVD